MFSILTLGREELLRKAEPVSDFGLQLEQLIEQMRSAMNEENGIGLAAPQIGINKRIFICQPDANTFMVFVNPVIIQTSADLVSYEEGCLSIPGVYADVLRPASVTVQAFDIKGKAFTLQASDILARIIQHENDHLDGILFIDRLSERKRSKLLKLYQKEHKVPAL